MSVGSMSLPSNQSDNSEADSDGLFGKLAGRVRHASLYGLDLRQKKSTRKIYHPNFTPCIRPSLSRLHIDTRNGF